MDTAADLSSFDRTFPKFCWLCLEEGSVNNPLLEGFKENFKKVSTFCALSDCRQVKFNGYRMALNAITSYMSKCTEERPKDAPHMFRFLSLYLKYVIKFWESSTDNQIDEMAGMMLSIDYYNEQKQIKSDLARVIGPYLGTLLSEDSSYYYSFVPLAMSVSVYRSVGEVLKRLISSDYRNEAFVDIILNMSVRRFKKFFDVAEHDFVRMFTRFFYSLRCRDTRSTTLTLNLATTHTIRVVENPKVDVIVEQTQRSSHSVRCRLYESKSILRSSRTKLIFHVHGGCLVSGSPDSNEMYLLEYAQKLPEASILSIDYSLAPEAVFPRALQEVFDVYQWVTSGSKSVVESLGFCPETVILTGDSCGIALLSAVPCIINDLRKSHSDRIDIPPQPAAIFSVYGAFALELGAAPSMLISSFDCLITARVMMAIHNELTPFSFRGGKHFNQNDIPQALLEKQTSLLRHPYWSAMYYEDFEGLKEISLVMVTTSVCPFSDTNVRMAKNWQGPVELHVIDKEPHGFLHMNGTSQSATQATQFVIEQLRKCL